MAKDVLKNKQDNTIEHIPDSVLIEGCRNNCPLSQGRLYRRYYSKLMSRCKGSLGNESDADEVVNKIFFYLFTKGLPKFDAAKGTSVETWLTRYVARDFVSVALRSMRAQQAREETFSFIQVTDEEDMIAMEDRLQDFGEHTPEGILSSAEESAKLRAAIDKLPDEDAKLCTLLYKDGLKLMEAAELLGLKYATASSRRRRAVAKLIDLAA
jgi:RNA polymerase sigma factor (sigma-70 family)